VPFSVSRAGVVGWLHSEAASRQHLPGGLDYQITWHRFRGAGQTALRSE
jgi:hypothetical protein